MDSDSDRAPTVLKPNRLKVAPPVARSTSSLWLRSPAISRNRSLMDKVASKKAEICSPLLVVRPRGSPAGFSTAKMSSPHSPGKPTAR